MIPSQPRAKLSKHGRLANACELMVYEDRWCLLTTPSLAQSLFCLFDVILYVPSTIFQLYRDGLPGMNQY